MKYDFFKSVSLLALFAAFTAVIFACGESDEPSAPHREQPTYSSSSMVPYSAAYQETEVSPIRFQAPSVSANGDQSRFNFSGSAILDGWDTTANADSENDPVFTDVILEFTFLTETGEEQFALIQPEYVKPEFPRPSVNLAEMGVTLYDPNRTQCGTFKLRVTLLATNDMTKPDKFVSVDSVIFVRDAEACIEPVIESSSSEPTIVSTVQLEMFEANVKTSKAISLKTNGEEVAADQGQITFSINDANQVTLIGLNGYKVGRYTNDKDRNWDDDWSSIELPPSPALISNFQFSPNKLAESIEGFDVDAFWVVVGPAFNETTGDDFFAITLKEKGIVDANGAVPLDIIFYKK